MMMPHMSAEMARCLPASLRHSERIFSAMSGAISTAATHPASPRG